MEKLADYDEILIQETSKTEREARCRANLLAMGNLKLVEEFDRETRETRIGIHTAKLVWRTIQEGHRRVLLALYQGRRLERDPTLRDHYDAVGRHPIAKTIRRICTESTVLTLVRWDMVLCDGPPSDRARYVNLVERGQFLCRYGRYPIRWVNGP